MLECSDEEQRRLESTISALVYIITGKEIKTGMTMYQAMLRIEEALWRSVSKRDKARIKRQMMKDEQAQRAYESKDLPGVKVRRLLSHIEGMASFQKALNKVVSEAIISGIVDYKPQVLTKGD